MSENNIISFEEFRKKKKNEESSDNPLTQVLKKDLREQEDLVSWYLFHNSFNKYKLFLHSLFYKNHQRLKGTNPNSGYISIFDKKQIDSVVKSTEDALKWIGRRYIIIDGNGKNLRQLGHSFPYETCRTFSEFHSIIKRFLLESDQVIVFKELSLSKIQIEKANIVRSFIKILDDAYLKSIAPSADLIFIDHASFLEKSWEHIGLYLDILPQSYR